MVLLQQGNRNRTTEPTRANETSSRSHAILQVQLLRFEFGHEGQTEAFHLKNCHRIFELSKKVVDMNIITIIYTWEIIS